MSNTNPTIVQASLDDKELQASINKMVANFDKGLQTMLEHSNEYVGKIQTSLQKIGDTNFGAKGSNDGAVVKQTKAQNDFTDAVKRSTNEIKRQGKEGEMSFDQIAAALSKARQTVSEFNTKRASGILPSSEDYKRYEQSLARIVEYNDKLKQSALTRADANQWANAFDGKRVVSDLTAVDDRLKQLNNEYKKLEAESKKAFGQDLKDAFKLPTASLDEVVKKISKLRELSFKGQDQGFISQSQIKNIDNVVIKLRELRREMESKAVPQSVANYIKNVGTIEDQLKLAFARANKIPTDQLDLAQAKLERLQALLRDMRERGILNNTQIASTEAEIRKLEQIIGQVNTAQQQTTQAAQHYTEEIRKQAQAIRESKQWKETGTYSYQIGDATYYVSKKQGEIEEQLVRHKEQQVNYEKEYLTAGMAVESKTQQQLSTEEKLNQVEQQRLATEQEIAKARREYVSPTTTTYAAPTTDMLRKFIASKAGVEVKDVKIFDETAASASKLQSALKQVQAAYSNMSAEERNSPFGQALIRRFQELQRESQKTQQQLSRPTSLKSVKGLDEKTLDDIAYKMQRLRAYRQGIDLTKPNAANEIKQVDEALAKLQKDADKWMSKSQQMIKSNTALGRSWNYMKNRLAFYFTVGASTQFIKNLIEIRSQYEMNERALGILINSAERGTQIFNELSQMALVSPYTLIELSTAAKQLTAYDVAAKDVVDTTRRLADMAAAVGIPIERLTYALGQIKAYGYLNSRDARMFANAGIPLVKQLSDYYTELEGRLVSTADVYDRIKKKAIDYNEVMEVINKMTDQGGKFFDFQAKMADTLKVRLANLTLAWNNMLNDMGKESQGVLTWGIGALREMFLHWKQLDSLIKNAAWALGIRTTLMFIAYSALKVGAALGVTTKQMALSAVFGKRLADVLKTVASAMKTVAMSKWTWISLFAIAAVEATQAIFGVNEAQKALNESIRNGAKDNYDNISKFLEQYKEVRDSLYSTKKVAIGSYKSTTGKAEATIYDEQQVGQDIDQNEAKKAWEAVREQIELTVVSSDKYIGNLLSISNMSERVRQGFNLLDDVQVVNAALKELDDDTIKVSKDLSAWWNAWQAPDGLIGNLKDYQEALNDIIAKYGTLESFRENTFLGGKGSDDLNDYETALERFRDDLQKTTDSIINFIELKGWSGDESKINQVFEQITQKLVLDNQLDPQKAFTLQTEVEEARSKAAKQALLQRINDEREAYKISQDESVRQALNADIERYNNWNETNGRSKVEWERFTKWLKEQHISETTAMFRNMDAEDIKSLNFQEGKHAEWVTRMVTQYAKEHKMSYDEAFKYLKSWVRSANQWSIYIPLTISTEDKKSVYDQLGEYDKAVDEADAQIERLTKRINELNAKKKKSKEETKELVDAEKELTQAQKDKADAEAKGGHGKKEKKDKKAANKAAKQAESELAKALKDELSTIDKVRSIYKDLVKDGASHANAVERATRGWDETVNAINRVLQKNGLQKLDLSKFAGIENPRELLNILQSQLETLVKRGASTSEIRVLQTKIQTVSVEADKYDLTMITKGLNSELGKLKDEYELAVELDANPEMGNLFADWMGIDMSTLPHTAEEYAKRMTKALNKYLADEKSGIEIGDLLALTDDDLRMFQQRVDNGELNQVWVDNIVKNTKKARNALKKENSDIAKEWDSLVQKYSEYEYKIAQVQRNANKERKAFALKYGSNAQKERALVLTTEIDAEEDQAKKQELINQLKQLLIEIAGDDDTKLKIPVAIDQKELEEGAKYAFEEFQKSPEWIVATGDLAGMTTKAIGGLIDSIESYKKKAKNLDPKQIKSINNALKSLYKQQRSNNPFNIISNAIMEAKERAAEFQPRINEVKAEMDKITADIAKGTATDKQKKRLEELIKEYENLINKQQEAGKISATTVVEGINNAISAAQTAVSMFNKMAEAIGGTNMTEAAKTISDITGNIQAAGQGAAAGAQMGGGWGAAIGATAAGLTDLVTRLADKWSGNADISEKVEKSILSVKRLENAYKNLEYAAENAFGAATSGAQEAIKANKELQLVELKRQLALEQSRSSKNRDEDKIIELRGQIIDLEYEIKDFTKNAVNDLLGISSHGDFFESMISEMIEAFKNGEDAMEVFEEKWSDMIDNMIMKTIVSQVLSQWVKTLEHGANDILEKYTEDASKKMAVLSSHVTNLRTMDAGDVSEWIYDNDREMFNQILESLGVDKVGDMYGRIRTDWFNSAWGTGLAQKIMDAYLAMLDNNMAGLQDELDKQSLDATGELIDYYGEAGKEFKENYLGQILDKIQENWNFGQDSEKQLSNLQQGIQGISENTAGALEAYMNGVSQQVYYHSSLLEQIRDSIVGLDLDVSLGVQSQMLLQLQSSYQVQMSIQGILEGVLTPSGRAFSVELMS